MSVVWCCIGNKITIFFIIYPPFRCTMSIQNGPALSKVRVSMWVTFQLASTLVNLLRRIIGQIVLWLWVNGRENCCPPICGQYRQGFCFFTDFSQNTAFQGKEILEFFIESLINEVISFFKKKSISKFLHQGHNSCPAMGGWSARAERYFIGQRRVGGGPSSADPSVACRLGHWRWQQPSRRRRGFYSTWWIKNRLSWAF